MATLTIEQKPISSISSKIKVEIDREQFERLASSLGLFNKAFLDSLERAEREVTQGKTKLLRSLRDLRSLLTLYREIETKRKRILEFSN